MSACGSYAGAQVHRKRGEPPCDPCRQAAAEYMREYRASHPKIYSRERRRNAARSRALWRLAARHVEEFQVLYLSELRQEIR